MKKYFCLGICLLAMGWGVANPAVAQHAGDAEFKYDGGSIVFEADSGTPGFADGHILFGADMGVGGLFDGFTDEPGFISETDIGLGIGPNDIIDYNVLQSRFGYYLNYWHPTTGVVENTLTTLDISDNPAGGLTVSALNGGTGTGVVGQADALGDFHSHVGFQLAPGSDFGVYGLLMELDSSNAGINNSQPFWIVFNYGVDEATHEAGVAYFAGVPEPGSLSILGLISLVGLTYRARRRIS